MTPLHSTRSPRCLALALFLGCAASGCYADDGFFRTVSMTKVNRFLSPYDGFNLETSLIGVNLAVMPGLGAGFELAELNLFYSLALGMYGHVGAPAYGATDSSDNAPSWILSGGLVYQPVPWRWFKPYLKVGGGGVRWRGDSLDGNPWAPLVEGVVGFATNNHWRASLDFYVAKGFSPEESQDSLIMAIRLNLVGFGLVALR